MQLKLATTCDKNEQQQNAKKIMLNYRWKSRKRLRRLWRGY